jgi:hypothetical protein
MPQTPEFDHRLEQSLAQQAISFALTDELAPVGDTSGSAVARLQDAISELQALPENSSIAWTQGYWQQRPGHHVSGYVEKDYPDGSKLHVTIQEAVGPPRPADSSWSDDALTISLRTAHPTDQSKSVRVGYRIERGGTAILCDVDKAFGANVLGFIALVDKLEEVDPSHEVSIEEMLGGVPVESLIMAEGLSPDLDTEIEELRDSSEAYKVVSDAVRHEVSGRQLEEQLGLKGERALSDQEAHTLANFLRTL